MGGKEGNVGAGVVAGGLVGAMGLLIGVVAGLRFTARYQEYQQARDAYQNRRQTLIQGGKDT
jgi:hypothetical protein